MHKFRTPALAAFALGEPILPVGYLPNGRAVFPIAGGAPDPDPDPKPDPDLKPDDKTFEPITSQADLDRVLGDRLARERAKFADYGDLKTKAAEFDKAAEAARTDQEKAVEAARAEGRTEALTAANTRLLSAEARALAAEAKFASPALAVRALDLADVAVNEDGSVDAEAIKTKLKELADSGAFVIGDGEKPKPKPDKAQGGSAAKTDASVARGRELFENRRGTKTTA